MERKSAPEAIREKLGIKLNSTQASELYTLLCDYLIGKDEITYVALVRIKYTLMQDGVSLPECDYTIMDILLHHVEDIDALSLASMLYVVRHQS